MTLSRINQTGRVRCWPRLNHRSALEERSTTKTCFIYNTLIPHVWETDASQHVEAIKKKKNTSPNSAVNQSWWVSNGKRKLFCIFFWSLMCVCARVCAWDRQRASVTFSHVAPSRVFALTLHSVPSQHHCTLKERGDGGTLIYVLLHYPSSASLLTHPAHCKSQSQHNVTLSFLSDTWQNIQGTRRRQAEMCLRWIFTWQTAH